MLKVTYVFIVLVFRTGNDIPGFLHSISQKIKNPYKVVIVNSFYDDASLQEIRNIALTNNCDFISIDNKGYGYGNNRGIEFANCHYEYEHLIVCNADIEINTFDEDCLYCNKLNAPMITTITNKKQNPFFIIRNPISAWLLYQGYKRKSKVFLLSGRGINKLIREIFLLVFTYSSKSEAKIYASHGSFLIFPHNVIKKITPVFDENMFLYFEEAFLAEKLYRLGIEIVLHKGISILHYEDGSTKGSNIDTSSYGSKSYIYFYENYIKK